jgi:hypothetical protein
MAITTTYTCDRCGAVQDIPDQMWRIGIQTQCVTNGNLPVAYAIYAGHNATLWCRKCVDEVQVLGAPPKPKEGEDTPKLLTIDERICAILAEFIEDVHSNIDH